VVEVGRAIMGTGSLSLKTLFKASGQLRESRMGEQEKMYFEKIIRKMVAYEPGERATMAEVICRT
jgi:hypothetical protein